MELETLTLTTSEGVAHVQLTRGEQLNTMTPQFWEDMIAAFEAIAIGGRHLGALPGFAGSVRFNLSEGICHRIQSMGRSGSRQSFR